MLAEVLVRFFLGGLVVCIFALVGSVLKPKSFAGIFGAAPSVALATLGIAFSAHGPSYVSTEGRSMILGALALGGYSLVTAQLLLREHIRPVTAAGSTFVVWFAIGFGCWGLFFR